MNPLSWVAHLRRQNFLPLWKWLRLQGDFYTAKINALWILLEPERHPVRVVQGERHLWLECDFTNGPFIVDWNAYRYKKTIKSYQEEPLSLKLLRSVFAPSSQVGEKILILDKRKHLGELQAEGLYATCQRNIPWSPHLVIPQELQEGLTLWKE